MYRATIRLKYFQGTQRVNKHMVRTKRTRNTTGVKWPLTSSQDRTGGEGGHQTAEGPEEADDHKPQVWAACDLPVLSWVSPRWQRSFPCCVIRPKLSVCFVIRAKVAAWGVIGHSSMMLYLLFSQHVMHAWFSFEISVMVNNIILKLEAETVMTPTSCPFFSFIDLWFHQIKW